MFLKVLFDVTESPHGIAGFGGEFKSIYYLPFSFNEVRVERFLHCELKQSLCCCVRG